METDSKIDFEHFVISVRPRLRATAFLLCGDWYAADDLAQSTLWKVYCRWGRLQDRTLLFPYARRVLVSLFASEQRRAWRHRETHTVTPDLSVELDDTVENRTLVVDALRKLGPRQRAVVVLRFFEDLSVDETAKLLECDPGTVKSQSSRALSTLREILKSPVDQWD
ncbi:SigE family RNA polymerase sigma factor [Streptacidiphilus sp. PAMC 29251]